MIFPEKVNWKYMMQTFQGIIASRAWLNQIDGIKFLRFYSEKLTYLKIYRGISICFHKNSTIQLSNEVFFLNKLMLSLFQISYSSSAIIQNNTLTENNVGSAVYLFRENSAIQLINIELSKTGSKSYCSGVNQNLALSSRIIYLLKIMLDGQYISFVRVVLTSWVM